MTKTPCIPISHLIYCIILFFLFLFLSVVYPLNPIPSCHKYVIRYCCIYPRVGLGTVTHNMPCAMWNVQHVMVMGT